MYNLQWWCYEKCLVFHHQWLGIIDERNFFYKKTVNGASESTYNNISSFIIVIKKKLVYSTWWKLLTKSKHVSGKIWKNTLYLSINNESCPYHIQLCNILVFFLSFEIERILCICRLTYHWFLSHLSVIFWHFFSHLKLKYQTSWIIYFCIVFVSFN